MTLVTEHSQNISECLFSIESITDRKEVLEHQITIQELGFSSWCPNGPLEPSSHTTTWFPKAPFFYYCILRNDTVFLGSMIFRKICANGLRKSMF